MSEADEDDMPQARGSDLGDHGSFMPAIHDGIPVTVAGIHGQRQYGRIGEGGHPPLACPNPRYPASIRGYYKCPGCGARTPLAGEVSVREVAYGLADEWMGALGQAAWIGRESIVYIAGGVVRVLAWLINRVKRRQNGQGVAPEPAWGLFPLGMRSAGVDGGRDEIEAS